MEGQLPVSREELHALVWSTPMLHAARQFGVSDSYLARVCTLLKVPRPERGYWAKLTVGKAHEITPLPTARPGDPTEWDKESVLKLPPPTMPLPRRADPPERHDSKPANSRPKGTHALIAGARKHFENVRPTSEWAEESSFAAIHLRPYKKLLVDILTSKAALSRSLEAANEFFNLLEERGIRVVVAHHSEHFGRPEIDEREDVSRKSKSAHASRWAPSEPTVAYVDDIAIGMTFVEMTEERVMRRVGSRWMADADYKPPKPSRYVTDSKWTTKMEKPTGRLRLVAYSPYRVLQWSRSWEEVGKSELREQYASITDSLAGIANDLRRRLVTAREEERREQEQLRIEHEKWQRDFDRARALEAKKASLQQLEGLIAGWAKANATNQFFSDLKRRAMELPDEQRDCTVRRIELAATLVGERDALAVFQSWLSPDQRYKAPSDFEDSDEQVA